MIPCRPTATVRSQTLDADTAIEAVVLIAAAVVAERRPAMRPRVSRR
jgi:hypothetical protein